MQQQELQSQIETMPIDELRAQFDALMGEVVVFHGDDKEKEEAKDVRRP